MVLVAELNEQLHFVFFQLIKNFVLNGFLGNILKKLSDCYILMSNKSFCFVIDFLYLSLCFKITYMHTVGICSSFSCFKDW